MKNNMMNNSGDELHPQDKRNLVIFIVASLVIWIVFDKMILAPRMEEMRAQQEIAAAQQQEEIKNNPEMAADFAAPVARDEAIGDSPRIKLENTAVSGSLSLKGGRIDDVELKDYFKSLDRQTNVPLFSPSGTDDPEYADFGWLAKDKGLRMPDKNTVWNVQSGASLAPDSPVTLYWENGQGLRFEREISIDDQYMFNIKRRVINNTGRDITLYPYALVTQHGLPEDHYNRWIVHEGPIAYVNDELQEYSYKKLPKEGEVSFSSEEGWTGLSDHYWMTALIPAKGQSNTYRFRHTKSVNPEHRGKFQVDITGQGQTIADGGSYDTALDLYVGTKDLQVIEQYEKDYGITHFDLTVDFGIFYFLTKPFYHILMFFANIFGNFGVAIICLTVVIRIAVFPLANKTFKSFAGMAKLAPEMQELKQKYKDDKAKLQQGLIKLYEREKVNPMAGCLPILIQIPIFFAIYKVLLISLEMRHAPFFGWIQDLSAPDPTTVFNLFGLIPWTPPDFLMFGAWSCLMLFFMIMQKKLTPPPADPTQQWMMYFFPYFISYILSSFAAGLVIYWTFSNGFSVIQQYVILKKSGADIYLFKSRSEKAELKKEQKEQFEKNRGDMFKKAKNEDVLEGEVLEKGTDGDGETKDGAGEKAEEATSKPVSKPKPKKKKKKK